MTIMLTSGSEPFDQLRDALARDPDLRRELEAALDLNVNRVNPSDPGGRFISGGAVEWIIAAVAYKAGILTVPGGHRARGFDLQDIRRHAKGLWSVKNQTTPTFGDYRLVNGMGGSGRGFTEPTIFLSPNLPGITFVDPAIHTEVASYARDTGDAWAIGGGRIRTHALAHPECVATCRMPTNPGTGDHDPGMDYTHGLLTPELFPRLSTLFREAKPPNSSFATELRELIQMRADGQISEAQFDDLVEKLGASN